MRILFDLGHPAHFHLFKHAISALRLEGHDVILLARQKDCLPQLVESMGWPYILIRRKGKGLWRLGLEALKVLRLVVTRLARRRIDLLVGTSIIVGPAARLMGAKSVVFSEDDAKAVPFFATLAYGPAHYVATPTALAHERHGRKHLTYHGYQKLAYLHPALYRFDESIRADLGLSPGQRYFVLRLVALRAHHDIGEKGLSPEQVRQILARLEPHGKVFLSAEADAPEDFHRYRLPVGVERIHDVLAGADMLVGDSQSMAIEAALLGTPSLRCNTFVNRLSVLKELDHHYRLTVGFRPEDFDKLLAQIDTWLGQSDLKAQWQRKRQVVLDHSVNVTEWILKLFRTLAPVPPEPELAAREAARVAARVRRTAGGGAPLPPPRGLIAQDDEPLQDKYAAKDPISRALVRGFFQQLGELLRQTRGPILDVGAGEGDAYLYLDGSVGRRGVTAVEINPANFVRMARVAPHLRQVHGSIYELPFADGSFDTVMCSEVLEHLEDPDAGLAELVRVCRGHLVLSVPREPIWRMMNLARGAYIASLGNTPGHIRHWSRRRFVRWVGRRARVLDVRAPLPWTMVLASPHAGGRT